MSTSLYELTAQYQFLRANLYDPETGEVNETSLAQLNNLNDCIESKCINLVKVYKDNLAEYNAISLEKKAMAKRQSYLKKGLDRLKEYLRFNMSERQINQIKCPQFVINLVNNPSKVEILDPDVIPENYKHYEVSFDREKMLSDMKKGVDIPGATLVQGNSIRIK